MAGKNPATKIEDRIRENELLDKQASINENLLKNMDKQAQVLSVQNKKLEQLNLAKQVQNLAEKETLRHLISTDILQNNILKRHQKIKETKESISKISAHITSNSVKSLKYTTDELKTMTEFRKMYGNFMLSKKLGGGLTLQEEDVLNRVSKIRGRTVAQMKTEVGIAARKTKEMMLQGVVQAKNDQKSYHRTLMLKETLRLRKEETKLANSTVEGWIRNRAGVSAYLEKLEVINTILVASGVRLSLLGHLMKTGPLLIGSLLLVILTSIVNLFHELDKSAFTTRKELGMMRKEHSLLRKQAEDLYKEYAHLGVTVESVYKTQKSISIELGSTLSSTKQIVEQASLMSAQFGISEDITVKMLKTLGQLSSTTAVAQTKMIGFAGALSNAAGIPLPQVMQDVANASETTRNMIAKTPLEIIKTAVEARRLGTTLDKMASSSRRILDFTSSIEAEMEASVLLGRPINLQLSRQLAYSGKIADSNREILRIAKQTDFDHMDVFQAEAFAKSVGKTVEEMKSMIQADREQNMLRAKAAELAARGDFSLLNQLKTTEELMRANESIAKSKGSDFNLIAKQQANQERLTSISLQWKKVLADIGMIFLPIIDNALKLAAALIPVGVGILKVYGGFKAIDKFLVVGLFNFGRLLKAVAGLGWIGKIFEGAAIGIKMFLNLLEGTLKIFTPIWNITKAIGISFLRMFESTRPLLSAFSKMKIVGTALGTFGKAIPVIGQVIMALQAVWSAGSRIIDIFKKMFSGDFAGAFKGMLFLIPGIIWDVLVKPIFELISWVGKLFSDKWKGWLDGIVDGIKNIASTIGPLLLSAVNSVGNMMFDTIIAPFKKSWEWISEVFGNSKKDLQPSIEKPIVSSKLATMGIPIDTLVDSKEIKSYKELDKAIDSNETDRRVKSSNSVSPVLDQQSALLAEIKGLRDDLVNGKIAVNMDGQLVSTVMNRNNKFRGTYGAMQT